MYFGSVFGDSVTNDMLGRVCADGIISHHFSQCLHSIRPVGINFFWSIPYLFTHNQAQASFICLFLNICCFIYGITVFNKIVTLLEVVSVRYSFVLSSMFFLFFFSGDIIHRLPDLIAFDMFLLTFYFGIEYFLKDKNSCLLKASFISGFVVFFRQPYSIYSLIVLSFVFILKNYTYLNKAELKIFSKKLIYFFPAIFLICLQFLLTYLGEGEFYFYSRLALKPPSFPNLAIRCFADPIEGAYMVYVPAYVGKITFYLTKMWFGIFDFQFSTFMGKDRKPFFVDGYTYMTNLKFYLVIYLSTFVVFLLAIYNFFRSPLLRIIVLSYFSLWLFFLMSKMHAEYRYFHVHRFLLFLIILFTISSFKKKKASL